MQAQKEVGSVCWGDLGKQEVSPWPNWPGLFPRDRFCPIRVNWTLSLAPWGQQFCPGLFFLPDSCQIHWAFFFLSIEMHNTVMGYSVITFAEDKVQAKKASFPAYPSYLTELNLFFKYMISHLLFSFQVLRADGTQNSLRELACLYFLRFADNLLNRHKPHSLSIQGSLSSQSKITGQRKAKKLGQATRPEKLKILLPQKMEVIIVRRDLFLRLSFHILLHKEQLQVLLAFDFLHWGDAQFRLNQSDLNTKSSLAQIIGQIILFLHSPHEIGRAHV